MRSLLSVLLVMTLLTSCKEENKEEEMPAINDEQVEEIAYMNYGAELSADPAMTSSELASKYAQMKEGDTLSVTVKGTIADVCPNKGCWVKLPVGQDTAFVKFKDYAFFLPKNGQGKEVVLEGVAYKSVTPVDELKHYAEDAGKSQAEIDAIDKDKVTLSFLANGALVEKFDNPDVNVPESEMED
ncbi:DUF4920 domain-containing protein [Nonlabens xiamenensis]|uniref:DUF4920 domain-containing protein n=1 Tax=Nonlabens xiamenensis TaxID=2341043 RepID=UPI000F61552D|nr:DUF4920 domain-containing protein [Nonlabens xiamenensis]